MFLFRLAYGSYLGILPDEAYYWDWSRNLAFGYFDHPPLIAYLIAFSRMIFGETVLGVRFMMWVCTLCASVISYVVLKKYVSRPSSLVLWAVLSNGVLLFGIGSLLATPDIPLVFFWSVSVLAAYNAIFRSSTRWWIVLGLAAGLGMMSKYTYVLFPISLALFLVTSKERRFWLGRWQPWAAAGLGLLVWLPNILWNQSHHWRAVLFQFSHGVNADATLHFDLLGDYLAGQISVLSVAPVAVLAYAAAVMLKKRNRSDRSTYLVTLSVVPFFFFLFASLQKKVEANWAACAYVTGFILVSIVFELSEPGKIRWYRRFAVFSAFFAAITTAVIMVHLQHPFLPIPTETDPATQAIGWKSLARDINAQRIRFDPRDTLPVCANRYQEAALFAYYLPDHPRTFALNIRSRDNQYSLWPQRRPAASARVIFLHSTDDPNLTMLCEKSFSSYALWATVKQRRGAKDIHNWGIITGTLR